MSISSFDLYVQTLYDCINKNERPKFIKMLIGSLKDLIHVSVGAFSRYKVNESFDM